MYLSPQEPNTHTPTKWLQNLPFFPSWGRSLAGYSGIYTLSRPPTFLSPPLSSYSFWSGFQPRPSQSSQQHPTNQPGQIQSTNSNTRNQQLSLFHLTTFWLQQNITSSFTPLPLLPSHQQCRETGNGALVNSSPVVSLAAQGEELGSLPQETILHKLLHRVYFMSCSPPQTAAM